MARSGTETVQGKVCYGDCAGEGLLLRLCRGGSATETMQGGRGGGWY